VIYPFLIQQSSVSAVRQETFLEHGRSTNGVIYFEQDDSWGGAFPTARNNSVRLKIKITDVFGKQHCTKLTVPAVSLADARKYNPAFGSTLAVLRNQPLPFDIATDPQTYN
jgi:hypothetical protein